MSALMKYLAAQQDKSLHLRTMLDALQGLNLRNIEPKIQGDLIGSACMVAEDLNTSLDIVNLPDEKGDTATATPVMRKYAEWKRSRDGWQADLGRDPSDENSDRWCAATFKLADEILGIPSEGPMDFIYKLMAYTFHGQHEIGDGQNGEKLWAEARALVES